MSGGAPTSAITVIGNVNADLIVRDASELPPPGEEWEVDAVELRPGGAAANCGLALAALGEIPRVVGSVGRDRIGALLLEELTAAGVATADVRIEEGQATGVSIAFEAPGRDRSFLTSLGCLATFDASAVPEDALTARLVLLGGYFLLPALRGSGTADLLRRARANGAMTCFDPGWDPVGWPPSTLNELTGILPSVDVFLPNEAEAAAIADTQDRREAGRRLQAMLAPDGWAVVKLGAEGCVAAGPEGARAASPAPATTVADSTGAGDAFNAGLLSAIRAGADVPDALEFAVKVASAVVGRPSSARYPARTELG
ncbi:MAG: carbohydrate kinase family protein [Actinomycetota bacterium]